MINFMPLSVSAESFAPPPGFVEGITFPSSSALGFVHTLGLAVAIIPFSCSASEVEPPPKLCGEDGSAPLQHGEHHVFC